LVVAVILLLGLLQFTGGWDEVRRRVGLSPRGAAPSSVALEGAACAAQAVSPSARAYVLALTSPVELSPFVRNNAALFAEDGDAIECYRRLAAALVANNDLNQVDALRERAEAERQSGLRFDRAAYTTDLAETVRELSDALPALANADDAPYRGTKAYDSAHAYLTLSKRAPGSAAAIDALIRADEAVLRELAERLTD
jgi:hypothetical protein